MQVLDMNNNYNVIIWNKYLKWEVEDVSPERDDIQPAQPIGIR